VNNGPRSVSAETRDKVVQAIRDLDYKPNAVARNLRRQRTSTLGLIIPDTLNPYFPEVARGIEAVAFENEFIVVLCHSHYDVEKELRYIDVLSAEQVAGVIWVPATEDDAPIKRLQDYRIPLVVLDRSIGEDGVLTVSADNFGGGYLATEYLIGLGHRRIGCITRPVGLEHSNDRTNGYRAALASHGLPFDTCLLAKGGYKFDDGKRAALELFDCQAPPTAIFAYNDLMAIGAIHAAKERGLRIPQDISIVGFDDIPGAAFTFPPLTTICQPKLEMGRKSAELLIASINGETEEDQDISVKMDVKLVIRQTTGPAPGSKQQN